MGHGIRTKGLDHREDHSGRLAWPCMRCRIHRRALTDDEEAKWVLTKASFVQKGYNGVITEFHGDKLLPSSTTVPQFALINFHGNMWAKCGNA